MNRKYLPYFTAFVILLLSATVEAGWIMQERKGDRTLISKGRLKSSTDGISWILDGPGNMLYFFDENDKTYAAGTVEDYCGATAALVEQTMKNLPAQQRQALEQMLKQDKEEVRHTVSVTEAGDGGVIAGQKTFRYKIEVDGELYEEIWLASDSDLVKEFRPLKPLLQKFGTCATTMGTEFTPENSPEYRQLMDRGVEVKSIAYAEGAPEPLTDVVKLDKADIPESEFAVPRAYRKTTFAEMLKSQVD
ncbi:MAG: hypothetical protein WAO07_11295 [Desulfobacterales bacterium]